MSDPCQKSLSLNTKDPLAKLKLTKLYYQRLPTRLSVTNSVTVDATAEIPWYMLGIKGKVRSIKLCLYWKEFSVGSGIVRSVSREVFPQSGVGAPGVGFLPC